MREVKLLNLQVQHTTVDDRYFRLMRLARLARQRRITLEIELGIINHEQQKTNTTDTGAN